SHEGTSEYELDWAHSYETGLKLIQSAAHDAYLVDQDLGAGNGLALVHEAASTGCAGPLILLTSQEDRSVALMAAQQGAADTLVKDQLHSDTLERSIRYALERGRRKQIEVSLQ